MGKEGNDEGSGGGDGGGEGGGDEGGGGGVAISSEIKAMCKRCVSRTHCHLVKSLFLSFFYSEFEYSNYWPTNPVTQLLKNVTRIKYMK